MPCTDSLTAPLAPIIDTSSTITSVIAKPCRNLMRNVQPRGQSLSFIVRVSNYRPGYLQIICTRFDIRPGGYIMALRYMASRFSEDRNASDVEVSSQDSRLNHRRLSKPSQVRDRL